jgi:hypothetical protein
LQKLLRWAGNAPAALSAVCGNYGDVMKASHPISTVRAVTNTKMFQSTPLPGLLPRPVLLLAAAILTAGGIAIEPSQAPLLLAAEATDPTEAQVNPVRPENLCTGGLEDGKIIVDESYLKNQFRETTRLGCEVDGGNPVRMPDLPAPNSAATRLV